MNRFEIERALRLVEKFCKAGILTGVLLCCVFTHAYAEDVTAPKHIAYEQFQNNAYDPSYDLALDILKPLFKGTQYDPLSPRKTNPFISIGQINLNKEEPLEIIAQPLETQEEVNLFCKHYTVCPFYIIDTKNDKPRSLGVIWAESLDRGDEIKNGYWTLKAYTKKKPDDTPYSGYFETYSFDKKQKKYILDPI